MTLYAFKSDVVATLLIFGYVLIWIVISEFTARSEKMSKEDSRKLLHIMVGNVVFFLPFFSTWIIAVLVPAFFILGNYLMSPHSPVEMLRMKTFEAGHVNGTIFYAISLTILVAVFFNNLQLLFASFLPLAYGDGLAAAVGVRATTGIFQGVGGKKSVNGTIALFVGSVMSVYLGLLVFSVNSILLALIVGILAVILELTSPRGLDNLVIPLGLAVILIFIYPLII